MSTLTGNFYIKTYSPDTTPRPYRQEHTAINDFVSYLQNIFDQRYAKKAGDTSQAFSIQNLTFPNGFTIEVDSTYVYIKQNGTVITKTSLTAHLAPDHQEL